MHRRCTISPSPTDTLHKCDPGEGRSRCTHLTALLARPMGHKRSRNRGTYIYALVRIEIGRNARLRSHPFLQHRCSTRGSKQDHPYIAKADAMEGVASADRKAKGDRFRSKEMETNECVADTNNDRSRAQHVGRPSHATYAHALVCAHPVLAQGNAIDWFHCQACTSWVKNQ